MKRETKAQSVTRKQRALYLATLNWFRGKRPHGWTIPEHVAQWQVNCTTNAELRLAKAIANVLRAPDRERA